MTDMTQTKVKNLRGINQLFLGQDQSDSIHYDLSYGFYEQSDSLTNSQIELYYNVLFFETKGNENADF